MAPSAMPWSGTLSDRFTIRRREAARRRFSFKIHFLENDHAFTTSAVIIAKIVHQLGARYRIQRAEGDL
jgi:hypothetical protein